MDARRGQNSEALHQSWAATMIGNKFGDEFIYYNKARHLAINSKVLTAFRKLYGETATWNRGPKYWELKQTIGETGE